MSTLSISLPVESSFKRDLTESIILAIVLTALSYIVATMFGWIDNVNALEAFAVFTSYSCTYLCVKQRRINYPIGMLSTAAYCILFWQQDLLASSILNLYLTPTLIYGWFRWNKDSETRPVQRVNWRTLPIYAGVTAAFFLGANAVVNAFDGALAFWDSAILIGTILAQFLLDNKKIETWFVWAAVNVCAIYVYATSGLPLAAFQYVFFLGNTIYGYLSWRKTMNDAF